MAEGAVPLLKDEEVSLQHVACVADVVHVRVIDELGVHVGGGGAVRERIWGAQELGSAPQVDHGGHSVGGQRLAAFERQVAQVVRPDENARAGEAVAERKATEVAGVLAVRPAEPARR